MDGTVVASIIGFLGVLATGAFSIIVAHIRRRDRPPQTREAHLSMAMVDNRSVDALAGSIEALNMTLTTVLLYEIRELRDEVRKQGEALRALER